jgi:hypothetical protein
MNWLRNHLSVISALLGLLVLSYLISITILYVYAKYGFEAQTQYVALLIAGLTLAVTVILVTLNINSLEFMKRDIEARVRP